MEHISFRMPPPGTSEKSANGLRMKNATRNFQKRWHSTRKNYHSANMNSNEFLFSRGFKKEARRKKLKQKNEAEK